MNVQSERLLAIGVDGAPGGWLAASCFGPSADSRPGARRTEIAFWAEIAALDERRQAEVGDVPMAVDIPIGLPELGGFRPCDLEARARLKGRSSTVFAPPARYLLPAAGDYERVREMVEIRRTEASERGEDPAAIPGVSAQSAALLPKIKEVDEHLRRQPKPRGRPLAEAWLFEVHPELSFDAMNAVTPLAAKKSARGQLERLSSVRKHFPDVEGTVLKSGWSDRGSLLDVVDAYAALWTALRWARSDEDLEILGSNPEGVVPRDELGLLQRIVV